MTGSSITSIWENEVYEHLTSIIEDGNNKHGHEKEGNSISSDIVRPVTKYIRKIDTLCGQKYTYTLHLKEMLSFRTHGMKLPVHIFCADVNVG